MKIIKADNNNFAYVELEPLDQEAIKQIAKERIPQPLNLTKLVILRSPKELTRKSKIDEYQLDST